MSFIQYASGIGGVIKYFSTQLICIQTRTQVQCRYFKYYSNIFAYTHVFLCGFIIFKYTCLSDLFQK